MQPADGFAVLIGPANRRPSCSPKTKRGGSRRISLNCRSWCASIEWWMCVRPLDSHPCGPLSQSALRRPRTRTSGAPKIFESFLAQFRVAGGVLNCSVAEPILDCPRVVASIGQGIAAGVAQHVDVNLEWEAGALAYALD